MKYYLKMVPMILAVWLLLILPGLVETATGSGCGEKLIPVSVYEQISLYSIITGFALFILAILIDKKKIRGALFGLAVIPILAWPYIHFMVDYAALEKIRYNYQLQAENTLANIAEAQDRYKSEHDTYLKDLDELKSHLYGAHGMDECVNIIKLDVSWDQWSASAIHVNSSEEVYWDSKMGSSLKRG